MSNRDTRTQSLILGGIPVPLGGEQGGDSVRISFGPQNTVTRGIAQSIPSRISERDGTLTIICYEEDVTHKVLQRIFGARDILSSVVPLPGTATNVVAGQLVAWEDCTLIEQGEFALGEAVGTVSWVVSLIGATRVSL